MKRRIIAGMTALVLLLGGLTGCQQSQKYSAHYFDFFDTATTITGYADSQEAFDRVAQEIAAQLGEYHRLYDIYLRYEGLNNLCTVNELTDGVHPTLTVDRRIIDLLLYAKDMYRETEGLTNVAMGSVLKLWHDHRTIGRDDPAKAALPPTDALQEAARHTDIDAVVIDEENSTVTLTDPAMRLDVGAIAKGYAVEQVARWMEQEGYTGYILNVGGNVRTVGGRPDGTGWTVGIENPADTAADYIAKLELSGMALVTSGSYQRYYIVDGQKYHHIIHPDTLMPAEGLLSVSVVCADSGRADALSTALFCMPVEAGMALVEALEGVEALWVTADNAVHSTTGWSRYTKQ